MDILLLSLTSLMDTHAFGQVSTNSSSPYVGVLHHANFPPWAATLFQSYKMLNYSEATSTSCSLRGEAKKWLAWKSIWFPCYSGCFFTSGITNQDVLGNSMYSDVQLVIGKHLTDAFQMPLSVQNLMANGGVVLFKHYMKCTHILYTVTGKK